MNKRLILTVQALIVILGLAVSSCQTRETQPTITPESTSTPFPTATSQPPTVTYTPTPVTEENAWKNNCNTAREIGQIGEGVVTHVAYSSDGNLAVVSAGGGVSLYDMVQQSRIWFYPTDKRIKQSVFTKDDSEIISLDDENAIIRFDAQKGRIIFSTGPVDAMTTRLSENGRQAILADWRGAIHVYDAETFTQTASTEEYIDKNATVTLFISDLVYSDILFSPDAALIMTAAFTGRITFFNSKTGKVAKEYPLEERAFPHNPVFSGDSRYMAIEYADVNQNSEVRILNINNGFLKQTFDGTNPALSRDGKLLSTRLENKIMIWNVTDGSLISQFETGHHLIGNPKFGFEADTLLLPSNRGIGIWNWSDGTNIGLLSGNFSNYSQVSADKSSSLIALLSDHVVEIRNAETGEIVNEIPFVDTVTYIALNEDGSQMAGITPQSIIIWEPLGGNIIQEYAKDSSLNFMAFTKAPNQFIFGDASEGISLVSIKDGKFNTTSKKKIELIGFASTFDGNTIATVSSNQNISIIDPMNGKVLKSINQGSGSVKAIAFAPSGVVLASATDDRTIKVWNTAGTQLCTLDNQPEYVDSLAFSSDGLNLYILPQGSGYLQIWGIASP